MQNNELEFLTDGCDETLNPQETTEQDGETETKSEEPKEEPKATEKKGIPLFNLGELKVAGKSKAVNADVKKLRAILKGAHVTEKWMDVVNAAANGGADVIIKAVARHEDEPEVVVGLDNTRRAWHIQTTLVKRFEVDGQGYLLYRLKGGRRPTVRASF